MTTDQVLSVRGVATDMIIACTNVDVNPVRLLTELDFASKIRANVISFYSVIAGFGIP